MGGPVRCMANPLVPMLPLSISFPFFFFSALSSDAAGTLRLPAANGITAMASK